MTNHTPTPWHIRGGAEEDEYHICAPLQTIAVCDSLPTSLCEANAAFIVRACNSHDSLLDALKVLVEAVEMDCLLFTGQPHKESRLGIAKAAIAKAEGVE